jgi:hypothetical protein
MPKPTTLPRWATGGTAQVVEPTEGKKDTGWVPLEKPPAQYENWARKLVYDWLVYLNGLANEAFTWAAKHTFAAGLSSGVAPSAANDVVRKTELDAEATARGTAITSAITTHNAVASPHSATAAVTASRLMLRDANGRSQVADPQVAADIATMGYVDGKFGHTLQLFSLGPNFTADPTNPPRYWCDAGGVVRCRGAVVAVASNISAVATLPSGWRPGTNIECPIVDISALGLTFASVATDGALGIRNAGVVAGHRYHLDPIQFLAEL